MREEEKKLREQIKSRIKIIDKDGNEWYDTMRLLTFIEKYYTALTNNKTLAVKTEWQNYSEIALIIAILGPDDDYVDWDEEGHTYITFENFQEIEHPSGWEWNAVDEITVESHLDLLFSLQDLDHDSLYNFLEEYIPLSQYLYIYTDYNTNKYDNGEEAIYSTDYDLLQLIIEEKLQDGGGFYIELIL